MLADELDVARVQANVTLVKAAGGARGGSQIPLEADPPAFRFRSFRSMQETVHFGAELLA
jgi:hypothetical protein